MKFDIRSTQSDFLSKVMFDITFHEDRLRDVPSRYSLCPVPTPAHAPFAILAPSLAPSLALFALHLVSHSREIEAGEFPRRAPTPVIVESSGSGTTLHPS